jgi:thioredoxin-related protein
MKPIFLKSLAAVAVLVLASLDVQAAEGWSDNYTDALARAKAEKKLLFVEFTGSDWCPPCKKQAAEVFAKQEFKDYAAKNLVLLQLDYPKSKELKPEIKAQNSELRTQFSVRGFPTMVVLDGEGAELGRWAGYDGKGVERTIGRIEGCKGEAPKTDAPKADAPKK